MPIPHPEWNGRRSGPVFVVGPDRAGIFASSGQAFGLDGPAKSSRSVILHVYTRGSGHCCLQRFPSRPPSSPPSRRYNALSFPSFHVRASPPFLSPFSFRSHSFSLPFRLPRTRTYSIIFLALRRRPQCACARRCAHFKPDFEMFVLARELAMVTAGMHMAFFSRSCTMYTFQLFSFSFFPSSLE